MGDSHTTTVGRCLVTGATGALGPAVVAHLQQHCDAVRVLTRQAAAIGGAPGVEVVQGDITRPDEVDRAAHDCEIIVHLAAHLHVNHPSSLDLARYENVNVRGTEVVVAAARRSDVRRLVLASTITVYGDGRGRQMDESTEPLPQTPYSRSKLRAEGIVLGARRHDGSPLGTVLRLAAVYGPRVKGNYRRLLDALTRRRFVPIGRGQNRRTVVHEHDVARAMHIAALHPRAAGRVFNITDGRCHALAQIIESICSALGRNAPHYYVPAPLARSAAITAAAGARLLGRPDPAHTMLEKYLEDMCVTGERARVELAFEPAFDLTHGWRHVVQQLRARDELR